VSGHQTPAKLALRNLGLTLTKKFVYLVIENAPLKAENPDEVWETVQR
jgi:hypothetical protein